MKNSKNLYLYLSATIANLLGLTCGIAYAWSSPVLLKLDGQNSEKTHIDHPINKLEQSLIVGFLSMGAILGPIVAGPTADKIGRKNTLTILAFPIIFSYFLMAFTDKVISFCIARFIMGLSVGSIYMILPMYLVEIAEDHNRGALGCLMAVFVTSGLLFAYIIGPYLSVKMFCIVCTIPQLVFLPFFIIYNPESPQFLVMSNRDTDLTQCLKRLRKKPIKEIEEEIAKIKKINQELNQNRGGIRELFSSETLRRGLTITVGLILLQQFSGINAILSYMQTIFKDSNSGLPPEISSIIVGIIQVIATIVTSALADFLGRRVLLLIALSGSCLSLALLSIYFFLLNTSFDVSSFTWLPVLSLILFIITFNLGLSSIPFTVMAEIFPSNVKSAALTLTTVTCFVGAFLITLFFPTLVSYVGMAESFALFAFVCLIGIVFVGFKVPETKGKSLAEIQILLRKHS